ncbi:MAG: RrF2 family transcriptional regulator [Chitinophagaceae bacterium]
MTDGRFAISMHILTLLAQAKEDWMSSSCISGSVNINPVLVRKEMCNLKKSGLILSKEGKNGGIQLAKPAHQIFLSEIYQSVKKDPLLGLAKNDPNHHCPIGCKMAEILQSIYDEVEDTLMSKLHRISLADFSQQFS